MKALKQSLMALGLLCSTQLLAFPRPTIPNNHCSAVVKDIRGSALDYFTIVAKDRASACQEAMGLCQKELKQRFSRTPGARCEEKRDILTPGPRPLPPRHPGPRPGPRPIPPRPRPIPPTMAFCDHGLLDRVSGYYVRIYRGRGRAPSYSQAKRIACNQSLAQCQRYDNPPYTVCVRIN